MADLRLEHDLLGTVEVPAGALYGIHTLRALESFPLARRPVHRALVHAYGAVKLAAARAGRGGDLVAIGDSAGLELWPSYVAHSIAKAGLLSLVKLLAKGMAPTFRVNAIVPGAVLPPDGTSAELVATYARRTLLQRIGQPADIADAVAYLLRARFVTGAILPVTGGSELWRGRE